MVYRVNGTLTEILGGIFGFVFVEMDMLDPKFILGHVETRRAKIILKQKRVAELPFPHFFSFLFFSHFLILSLTTYLQKDRPIYQRIKIEIPKIDSADMAK